MEIASKSTYINLNSIRKYILNSEAMLTDKIEEKSIISSLRPFLEYHFRRLYTRPNARWTDSTTYNTFTVHTRTLIHTHTDVRAHTRIQMMRESEKTLSNKVSIDWVNSWIFEWWLKHQIYYYMCIFCTLLIQWLRMCCCCYSFYWLDTSPAKIIWCTAKINKTAW